MLPSQGLFKEFQCPYNKDENTGCHRPFCHFKHPRRDEPLPANPCPSSTSTGVASYPRYVPFPIVEDEESSGSVTNNYREPPSRSIPSWNNTAEYVPQAVATPATGPDIVTVAYPLNNGEEDSEDIEPDVKSAETDNAGIEDKLQRLLADGDEPVKRERDKSKKSSSSLSEKPKNDSKNNIRSDRERSERSSSSSNSDRKRSISSGHRSSSSSRSSSKHGSNGDETRSSSSSKSSSSHRHKSSSSSSSSSTSRSGTSSRSSRRSSSDHHKRRHKSDNEDREEVDGGNQSKRPCLSNDASPALSPNIGIDSVEAECMRIFNQFDLVPLIASSKPEQDEPPPSVSVEAQLAERFNDPSNKSSGYQDSGGAKKRVAHDAGSMSRPIDRAFQAKPKHMQTALQSVFLRTEAVRKQRLEEEERAKIELDDKEAQLNKILATTPPPGSFKRSLVAPVANIIAIQNAKRKIEELKQQQLEKTIARSAPRVTGEVANVTKRIAHKATGAAAEAASAPPVLEGHLSKINFNLRMQYYNLMVKQCTAIYDTKEDAWERAQTEELAVFKKCGSAVIYKSSATLAINKLRKESISAGHAAKETGNKVVSHDVILAGKMGQKNSWSINRQVRENNGGAGASSSDSTILSVGPLAGQTFDTVSSSKAYNLVAECRLTEEQLKENGFPRPGAQPGQAIVEGFYRREQPKPRNDDERYCQRCGKLFNVESYLLPATDECNYHPKGTGYRRGFADNQHRCCQQPAGTPGCSYSDYHVSNYIDYANLTGFVKTVDNGEDYVCTRKDIFALDCEMVYTTRELELARVTVVDINKKIVYDACVKPDNHIVDYNTQFSGLTEEILRNENRSLRDIQAVLLSMFHAKTILVGHSLDSDLKALKIIHDTVVDTSVLFPHKMGLPKKKALKTLCIDHLKRIIQENDHGHNSAEDAEVCIDLIKAYLKNRVN